MSDDDASFEVILRDGVSRKAPSVAAGFKKVHGAASSAETAVSRGNKALDQSEKQLKSSARAAGAYTKSARKAAKVNPFGEFGKNTGVFKSRGHVNQMWDAMVTGQRRFAQEQSKPALIAAARRRTSRMDGAMGAGGKVAGGAAMVAGAGALAGGYAAYQAGSGALGAVKFRDEAITGLTLITRSADEANRVFKDSVVLADQLGQDWETTVGGMQKLLGKGFKEDFAVDMTKGLADLAVVAPDANVGNLLLAIGQIKTAGKLQGDELNQLTEAGLNSNLMFEQLEKRLGKSREEVLKLKEGGKLLADDVLPAILDSIQSLTGKGLGQAAEDAMDTVAGRMRRLEQLPGRFFLAVAENLEKSPLDGALANVLAAFDPNSEAFGEGVEFVSEMVRSIAETIDDVLPAAKEFGVAFSEAFLSFEGIEGEGYQSISDMFRDPKTIESIRMWGDLLGDVAAALTQIAKLAGYGAAMLPSVVTNTPKAIGDYGASTGGHWGPQGEAAVQAKTSGEAIGDMMAHGFWGRLFGGTEQARAGGVALAAAAEEGMRSREGADIHSPSKKTEAVAGYMTSGLVGGLDDGARQAEQAGQGLGAAPVRGMASRLPDVASGSASAGSTGGSITLGDITIPIQGIDPGAIKNPEELARAVRRELQRFFDGLNQQGTIQNDDEN